MVHPETRFRILEGFARVTAFTTALLEGPGLAQDGEGDSSSIVDYEPARVYLARWQHDTQVARAAAAALAESDDDVAVMTLSRAGRLGMLKEGAALRRAVWDEAREVHSAVGAFMVLSTDTSFGCGVAREAPLCSEEWRALFSAFRKVPPPQSQLLGPADPLDASLVRVDPHRDEPEEDDEVLVDLNENGKITEQTHDAIRRRIFAGGIDPSLRKQVWPFLFNLYPWDSTHAQRMRIKSKKTIEYAAMKQRWLAVAERLGAGVDLAEVKGLELEDPEVAMYRDAVMRVDKDVPRTDRGHPFYNDPNTLPTLRSPGIGPFSPHQNLLRDILITYACSYKGSDEIGYVQGMSDLLSPILIVSEGDEVDAFWMFADMMESKKQNFVHSGAGMNLHLTTLSTLLQHTDPLFHHTLTTKLDASNFFFAFRWFLVSFKREFSFEDTCVLWEAARTRCCGGVTGSGDEGLLYFVALAVLDEHRDAIGRWLLTFDELLKYINDLSLTIPIQSVLEAAEVMYLRFREEAASVGVDVEDGCESSLLDLIKKVEEKEMEQRALTGGSKKER
ncbi:hypothetical protein HDU98_011112 [Podochytrium sp. JEL0797]|nr:hypothetical protein HDU98_011112 [Podochytrium sp. JEL0797]